eukprot:TRINITY_DN4545_c0_g1_i1.p1 TRINITY_DN4545_c0_g1~~TRINITY_DN4545_c0_g1_i1.p1  ORF type:complete len:219 (-),score=71.67 TRINITY_DN4545_c0_g1_i1:40-696(-)
MSFGKFQVSEKAWDESSSEEEEVDETPVKPPPSNERFPTKSDKKKKGKQGINKIKMQKALDEMNSPMEDLTEEERARIKKLQEDSDYQNTLDMLGVQEGENLLDASGNGDANIQTEDLISIRPRTEADFQKFGEMIIDRITEYEESYHFNNLITAILTGVTREMAPEEVKAMTKKLNIIANEKIRKQGKKKKGKKATKTVDKAILGEDLVEDEFDFLS